MIAAAGLALLFYRLSVAAHPSAEAARLRITKIKSLPEIVALVGNKSLEAPTRGQMLTPPTENGVAQQAAEAAKKTDLQRILRTGDSCALIRIMDGPLNYGELGEYLLSNRDVLHHSADETASFEKLFKDGDGSFSKTLSNDTEILKFYNALLFGNLLEGVPSPEVDMKQAEILLSELASENSRNGAFPYFLVYVKEKLGSSSAEIDQQIQLALNAPSFDTYVLEVSQRLWERGLQDPTSLIVARIMISKMPIPNYNAPYFLIRDRIASQEELRLPALEFGKRLMNHGIEQGREKDEFVYWLAIEHAIGHTLYMKAWALLQPNQPLDPKYSATYKDIMKAKNEADPDRLYKENGLFQKISRASDYCPKEKLEEIFDKKRREFLEFVRPAN